MNPSSLLNEEFLDASMLLVRLSALSSLKGVPYVVVVCLLSPLHEEESFYSIDELLLPFRPSFPFFSAE